MRTPQVGDPVLYHLSPDDCQAIRERRAENDYKGNDVSPGQVYPGTVVRVWGDIPTSKVNLKVDLDGQDSHWITSVEQGTGPRKFQYRDPDPE